MKISAFLPRVLLILAFLLQPAATLAQAAPEAPLGGDISGTVTSPLGYPLPDGTLVRVFDAGGEYAHGEAVVDVSDGSFSMGPLPNGLFLIKAVPPAGSGLTHSLPAAFLVMNAPVDVGTLALTSPQVIGSVFAPDGSTPAEGRLVVSAGDDRIVQQTHTTTSSYAVGGLPAGDYKIAVLPTTDDPYWRSEVITFTISSPETSLAIDLTFQEADLWGYALDAGHNPLKNAVVKAASRNGSFGSDLSSETGYWAIGGLADGVYLLSAHSPWQETGLLPPAAELVTVPGAANPLELVFQDAEKILSGVVKANLVNVENAKVVARQVNRNGEATALTDANGRYELNLSSGLWAVSVQPISQTVPAGWVYPFAPTIVAFRYNSTPEARTVDFNVLLADASLSGMVELPGGGAPDFAVTIGIFNNQGIGMRTTTTPGDGNFWQDLPAGGYKILVHSQDERYLGPLVDPVTIAPEEDASLGTLTLLARDALISGTVTDEGGSGVAGIPLVAWREGAPESLKTVSGPDGVYALSVTAGDWHIQPAPLPAQPYVYAGNGEAVHVESSQLVENINFTLTAANSTLTGVLVDISGAPVGDESGWASAQSISDPEVRYGGPIENGAFSIKVPAGTYRVAARLPAGSEYLSSLERQVTIGENETLPLTLTVQTKDATIAGALFDPRSGTSVLGVAGIAGAWSDGAWAQDMIEPTSGLYRLNVGAGVWQVNYRIDPRSNYARLLGVRSVAVESNQTVLLPLPITHKDALIKGMVQDPDGHALPGAMVTAFGVGGLVDDLHLSTLSRADGSFSLHVPYGNYRLGAAIVSGNADGWVKPAEILLDVPENGLSGPHILQFQRADATLSGTLTVENAEGDGRVHVLAWTDDGGFVRGVFPVTFDAGSGTAGGTYTLDVLTGKTWHVKAIHEDGSRYWMGRGDAAVSGASATLDLALEGPYAKPGPVVRIFDAAEAQQIELADGTTIYIPAGAMPVQGTVILRIVPLAGLPDQAHANVVDYGYAFLATGPDGQPIEQHFNQEVVITFHYTDEYLQQHRLTERGLRPAYFATATDAWEYPASYYLDTGRNEVTMQIDHFTDFALLDNGMSPLYLPVVTRR